MSRQENSRGLPCNAGLSGKETGGPDLKKWSPLFNTEGLDLKEWSSPFNTESLELKEWSPPFKGEGLE